jgi:hypothetical protein
MNGTISIGMAAAVVAGLGFAASQRPASVATTVVSGVATTGGKAPADVFRLESAGGQSACVIRKGPALAGGRFTITPGPRCAAIFQPLGEASIWREGNDRTVDFLGRDGRVLVEFALADGAGYESVRPRSRILSLVSE